MTGNNCTFSVGILDHVNGHKLRAIKPDEAGFYTVCVGCLGIPTRGRCIYDTESFIKNMTDPTSRFNVCLTDGNLSGEYDHPLLSPENTEMDMHRLFAIDNTNKSHYFRRIWVDDTTIMVDGKAATPIWAELKPCGPKGEFLKQELEDPYHNTAFSMRTLCNKMAGPDPSYTYLKISHVITFDAVHAPGFAITSKRYSPGTECFDISRSQLESAVCSFAGQEADYLTQSDVVKLYDSNPIYVEDRGIVSSISGERSFRDSKGRSRSAMSLLYGKV